MTPASSAFLLRHQSRVIVALMLRNIRTRFFAHGLGYIISVAWPLVHILFLVGLNAFFDRAPPLGDSMVLFVTVGLLPFITFHYMSRFIMTSVLHTRSLLAFPAVKIVDILLAGAILELLSSCLMVIILGLILTAFGIDVMPQDPIEAASALGAAMLLGFGYGIVFGLAVMANPHFGTVYGLSVIFWYLTSGIFFLPESMPEGLRYYLAFNPVLQTTEWMRAAYYLGYGSLLDKSYTLFVALATLFVGFVMERLFRGRFLIEK